jgi:hypothetical protein
VRTPVHPISVEDVRGGFDVSALDAGVQRQYLYYCTCKASKLGSPVADPQLLSCPYLYVCTSQARKVSSASKVSTLWLGNPNLAKRSSRSRSCPWMSPNTFTGPVTCQHTLAYVSTCHRILSPAPSPASPIPKVTCYVCMHVLMYTYVCMYVRTYVRIYVYIYVCLSVCMYAFMHVCMYMYVYIIYI